MERCRPPQVVSQYYEHPPRSHLYCPASPAGYGSSTTHSPVAVVHFHNESVNCSSLRGGGEGGGERHPSVTDSFADRGSPAVAVVKPEVDFTVDVTSPEASPRSLTTLSTLLLTGLMYTFAISGAYGIEESVKGGGVLLTIVSVVMIPIVMGVPMALVVAELASAVPSNAGFLMWIKLSFHRAVYLSMAIMSFIYVAVDNALYPTMFSEYMCSAVECSPAASVGLRLGMLAVAYVLNVLGVEAVGVASVALTILTVAPFVLMFLHQLLSSGFYVNWQAVAYVPPSIEWATFLATASWCLSGIEQAGTVAEEVKDPQHTIIGSLVPLMGLAIVTYVPPIITGASVSHEAIDLEKWTTGYWTEVSYQVGGNALKFFTVGGSILSAFGLTLSALCTTTRIIAGMALTEVFPGQLGEWLSQRNDRFGTYPGALTLNTLLTALFSTVLGFGPLVQIDQGLYGIRVVLILLSFYRFRQLYPYLPRPFRIPLEGWRLHLMMGVALASSVVLTVISTCQELQTFVLCVVVVAVSVGVSLIVCRFFRQRDFAGRIVTFVAETPATET